MMRTSGGGESENQVKRIFEKLMAKNFSDFQKSMNWHTEVAKWITKRINADSPTKTHYIQIVKSQIKVKIFKAAREKQCIMFKGYTVRWTAEFSSQSIKPKGSGDGIFKVLKEKTQPRM